MKTILCEVDQYRYDHDMEEYSEYVKSHEQNLEPTSTQTKTFREMYGYEPVEQQENNKKTLLDYFMEHIENTPEEVIKANIEKIKPKQLPEGWLSLDEYPLPTDRGLACFGHTILVKMKHKNKKIYVEHQIPGDPRIATIQLKERGFTHWFNGDLYDQNNEIE